MMIAHQIAQTAEDGGTLESVCLLQEKKKKKKKEKLVKNRM